ncbi:MAG: hypothetical protein WDM77_15370 [Steroidobacteraceae bacterium]
MVTGRLEEDLPLDLQKFGYRVDTITATQIRNGGYIDVAQALQALAPGLYLSPKNGPFGLRRCLVSGVPHRGRPVAGGRGPDQQPPLRWHYPRSIRSPPPWSSALKS